LICTHSIIYCWLVEHFTMAYNCPVIFLFIGVFQVKIGISWFILYGWLLVSCLSLPWFIAYFATQVGNDLFNFHLYWGFFVWFPNNNLYLHNPHEYDGPLFSSFLGLYTKVVLLFERNSLTLRVCTLGRWWRTSFWKASIMQSLHM